MAGEIIDLTSDDSKDVGANLIATRPPYALPLLQLPASQGDPRPLKRQRTGDPPPQAGGVSELRKADVAAALGRCLEDQIFPHVERATAKLSPDIYDLDKLGAKVIRTIVDKDFERHFNLGGGRLSSSVELTIAAGVHRLVIELSSNPDYRRSQRLPPDSTPTTTTTTTNTATTLAPPPTTASAVAVPAILPSVEHDINEDDNDDNNDDGKNNSNNDEEEQEDEGEGEDEGGNDGDELDADNAHIPINFELQEPVPPSIHTPPLRQPPKRPIKGKPPVSPQQLRTRAKANQWQSGRSYRSPLTEEIQRGSFGLPRRPYISALARQHMASGIAGAFLSVPVSAQSHTRCISRVFHVDFSNAEIQYLQYVARLLYGKPFSGTRSTLRDLRNILKKVPGIRANLAEVHAAKYAGYRNPPLLLTKRSPEDITRFLNDVYAKKLNTVPQSLFIEYGDSVAQSEASRASTIPKLLLSREITGNRLGAGRTYQNFTTTVKSNREDYLEPQIEWTNCAGDIMTVSWLSNTDFVCGTTTHSDSHNQQYNKPGNLLLGSAATNTLRAYPDHRIIRPLVSTGDNSLESMVASQDPWLFTSVVSSDYDPSCNLAFTSSFDKTVKVWTPGYGSMAAVGTWEHGGHVNFVVASKNGTATVATAADVPTEAVRVYHLDRSNISGSRYDSYSCTRVHDDDYVPSEKWAYYPAAIRWGLAPSVNHLLLIGYSPRSPTGEDHEIPEDKLDTGELCLWDTSTRTQVRVNSAKTQNVFEVAWHPSRESFAAATSASQVLEKTDQSPRTQVRIFEINGETGQYSAIKTLDCAAIDINELSIRPNCLVYSYVAASCTNGKVYVWDTAGSDLPMCVLEHGDPVEELLGEREREDVGVKFAAWATTADRLYTGSSDGVVKVWNIRHGRGVLVKDLIEVAAPITYGAFSPDFTRLVIGDGSGRVYLLALEDPEDEDPPPKPADVPAGFFHVPTNDGHQRAIRRPRPFLTHPELLPSGIPAHDNKFMEGQKSAREYIKNAQLMLYPDPTIGAVQGPNYTSTSLFRKDAHFNEDPNQPLLATFREKQQDHQRSTNPADTRKTRLLRQLDNVHSYQPYSSAYTQQLGEKLIDSYDAGQNPSYLDIFDHATWLELKEEKAELDDSLIELDYETSIFDSDDEDD